jgi:hypothetical protein
MRRLLGGRIVNFAFSGPDFRKINMAGAKTRYLHKQPTSDDIELTL